jgi:hypothetical protein
MKAFLYRVLMVLAVAFAALQVSGQCAPGSATTPCKVQPAKDQPYTAEFKITNVQTLANGTTITHESTEVVARDSQFRNMTSTTEVQGVNGHGTFTHVNVNDPVAGTQSMWSSVDKKATVYKLPPLDQRHGCWSTDSGHFRSSWSSGDSTSTRVQGGIIGTGGQGAGGGGGSAAPVPAVMHRPPPAREDLGTTTIQGVEAHGYRTTTTIPAGEQGNDQPLVTTREVWLAPSFNRAVREVIDDPRMGKRTMELVNLTQSEPDLSVFQPPEGYEVVIEEMHEVPCQQTGARLQ